MCCLFSELSWGVLQDVTRLELRLANIAPPFIAKRLFWPPRSQFGSPLS